MGTGTTSSATDGLVQLTVLPASKNPKPAVFTFKSMGTIHVNKDLHKCSCSLWPGCSHPPGTAQMQGYQVQLAPCQEASCCSVLTEFSVLCGGNKKGVFDLDRREVPALNKEKLEYTHTYILKNIQNHSVHSRIKYSEVLTDISKQYPPLFSFLVI